MQTSMTAVLGCALLLNKPARALQSQGVLLIEQPAIAVPTTAGTIVCVLPAGQGWRSRE